MCAHLSVGERWRVVSMKLDQGMIPSHTASIINYSTQTVYNILNLFRETNDMIERRGRGGTNSLTADARINSRFYRRTGFSISSRTIRNYRRLFGFHPVHARIQPLINEGHSQQRLLFSERHIDHN